MTPNGEVAVVSVFPWAVAAALEGNIDEVVCREQKSRPGW